MTIMDITTIKIMHVRATMSTANATFFACWTLFSLSHTLDPLFQTLENKGPCKRGETAFTCCCITGSSSAPVTVLVAMACEKRHSGTAKATTTKLIKMNLLIMVGYDVDGKF